jgi:hypothetical protein
MQSRFIAMKITVLSAVLVAGAVSLVSAAPEKKESTERVSYTEKGKRDTPKASPDTEGWIELATPTPASHGREFIFVDEAVAPIEQLRITATANRPIVRSLRIEYRDGTQRVVRLDKVVDAKHPAYVDLRGPKRIERVTVVSEGSSKATYALHGAPARSGVATR